MFALDAVSRALLGAAAFAAFGAAFVATPIVARGDAAVVTDPTPFVAPLPARTAFVDVPPRRDPFAGGDTPAARLAAPQAQTAATATVPALPAMPQIPALSQIPAALHALPPNAGAGDGTFPFATGARAVTAVVTAVITGPHPFALVDEAGTTRVLTVGDRIDGTVITAIGTDGVRLSGGSLLPVAASTTSAVPVTAPITARIPTPAPTAHPIPGGRP